MLRVATVVPLILTLFGNAFLKSIVLVDFTVNQEFIVKTLCIQKYEVNNTCKGQCHLSKQLDKADKGSNDSPTSLNEIQEVLLFVSPTEETTLPEDEFVCAKNPTFATLFLLEKTFFIFHPPQLI